MLNMLTVFKCVEKLRVKNCKYKLKLFYNCIFSTICQRSLLLAAIKTLNLLEKTLLRFILFANLYFLLLVCLNALQLT